MRSKLISSLILICMLFSLASCGLVENKIPELTEDEEALVVEYASSTLLKYDANNGDKIGKKPEDFIIPVEPEPTPEIEWVEPEIVPTPEPEDGSVDTSDIDVIDNTSSVTSYDSQDLEKAFELDDQIDFIYEGYSIVESYPDSLDSYFVMNASKGTHLVILKFTITNITNNTLDVDMGDIGGKFRISLNGISKNALTTMLLNDLAFYRDTIDSGASDEVVIVGEYADEDLNSVDSLQLILKSEDGNKTINLE